VADESTGKTVKETQPELLVRLVIEKRRKLPESVFSIILM